MSRLITLAAAEMEMVGRTKRRLATFNFAKHRRTEHSGLISGRAGLIGP